MCQAIKEVEINFAYRWFLGIGITDEVPHFTTFGKNDTRHFKDTDLSEQIFFEILNQCIKVGVVNLETIFVDGTHVKAYANRKKI